MFDKKELVVLRYDLNNTYMDLKMINSYADMIKKELPNYKVICIPDFMDLDFTEKEVEVDFNETYALD